MRLAIIPLLFAVLPSLVTATAAESARGPARLERDIEVTTWRGEDRISEYTVTAYAGGIIEFVRDALGVGSPNKYEGIEKMTNAERLKRGLKIAKPVKMRTSGGEVPTKVKPAPAKRSALSKRSCSLTSAGHSAWQACSEGHQCSTAQAYACSFEDSYEDCQSGCGWGCASVTYDQNTEQCLYYCGCCSEGLVKQF